LKSTFRKPRFEVWRTSAVFLVGATLLAAPPRLAAAAPPSTSSQLVPGKTVVPPLTGPAAASQKSLCARMCETLTTAAFEARLYTDPKNAKERLRYRLFTPPGLDRAKKYPLILSLHGGGARRFEDLLICATPVFAFGPARFVAPEEQARHPAFVLVPWSGGRGWGGDNLRLILGLLETLRAEFPIDEKRLYVTGQSMGGFGAWQMITEHPDVFAAGVPVCGGGTPRLAPKAKNVPVWAFHGNRDGIVPVAETRDMITALLKAGGRPIYWEYDGATHATTAERAYCEPQLLDWLFAQAKR
jgi:predicted peptidase